jgi:hypothetical protein
MMSFVVTGAGAGLALSSPSGPVPMWGLSGTLGEGPVMGWAQFLLILHDHIAACHHHGVAVMRPNTVSTGTSCCERGRRESETR